MEERIKADWGKLSKKFLRSIIYDIIDDLGSSKEELINKYAVDKERAEQIINNDSHSLQNQMNSHNLVPFNHNEDKMDVDSEFAEEEKSMDAQDPLSWDNIEHLFGGNFKNTLTKHIRHGKVLLQVHPCLCGFHTYFNMRNTIESLVTDDPLDKVYYHLRTNIRTEFWSDYNRTRKLLLDH